MLAAILCNLDGAPPPPPPPPVSAPQFFGGGPFCKRYGYDWNDDDAPVAQEAREALPGPKAEKAEAALFRAVEAIRNDGPERVVLDDERVFLGLRGELRSQVREIIHASVEKERIAELWRAEIKRRVQEREDEEIAVVLLFL